METARYSGSNACRPIDIEAARAHRLAAKVLEAFSLACELNDLNAAEALLKAADDIISRQGADALKAWGAASQGLVDAHFRLWEMRYLVR